MIFITILLILSPFFISTHWWICPLSRRALNWFINKKHGKDWPDTCSEEYLLHSLANSYLKYFFVLWLCENYFWLFTFYMWTFLEIGSIPLNHPFLVGGVGLKKRTKKLNKLSDSLVHDRSKHPVPFFKGLKMFKPHYVGSVIELSNYPLVKTTILTHGRTILHALYGRTGNLYKRYRLLNNFYSKLVKMNTNHGVEFTIKFLKANQLAIQKKIAGTPFTSLREVEPDLPMPRLSKAGLPIWISNKDRGLIMSDSYIVIRLWLTLFGLYRIFKSPPKGQIETILKPYTGTYNALQDFNLWIRHYGVTLLVRNLTRIPSLRDLEVKETNWLLTSGPLGKVSYREIFSNLYSLSFNNVLMNAIKSYLDATNSVQFKWVLLRLGLIVRDLIRSSNIFAENQIEFLKKGSFLWDKENPLGRLSFKEEASGKVRVFAIVDVITQSLFTPLHKTLFEICRELPTDSLFDQNQAFIRCLKLSQEKGCSWGFDLSAATDRLPIENQEEFLNSLFGRNIGSFWKRILTWRDFIISPNDFGINNYFNTGMKVRYAVGQPMGALSSWAMLNLIHHMMVQYSAWSVKEFRVDRQHVWFVDYQILGDDLVIFDKEVADYYQSLCRLLGVSINLKKSILSPSRPVCEFAKRTGLNGKDVSALSFKELLSNSTFFGKFGFFTSLVNKGYLKKSRILNSFVLLNSIEDKSRSNPGMGLVAYILQNIYSAQPKLTFEDIGPFLNDKVNSMHYFGKNLRYVDLPGIKQVFLSLFDGRSVKKPYKGEYRWWDQLSSFRYILLYQLLFKLDNLFGYSDRFLQLTQRFIESFGIIEDPYHYKILGRLYRNQYLIYYQNKRDELMGVTFDVWNQPTLIELENLLKKVDSVAQTLGFYNFTKTPKTPEIDNPLRKIWFFHLLNHKGPKNLLKAIESMRVRGDFVSKRPVLGLFCKLFNFSNLDKPMDTGFKKVFLPPIHFRRDNQDQNPLFGYRSKKSWFWQVRQSGRKDDNLLGPKVYRVDDSIMNEQEERLRKNFYRQPERVENVLKDDTSPSDFNTQEKIMGPTKVEFMSDAWDKKVKDDEGLRKMEEFTKFTRTPKIYIQTDPLPQHRSEVGVTGSLISWFSCIFIYLIVIYIIFRGWDFNLYPLNVNVKLPSELNSYTIDSLFFIDPSIVNYDFLINDLKGRLLIKGKDPISPLIIWSITGLVLILPILIHFYHRFDYSSLDELINDLKYSSLEWKYQLLSSEIKDLNWSLGEMVNQSENFRASLSTRDQLIFDLLSVVAERTDQDLLNEIRLVTDFHNFLWS